MAQIITFTDYAPPPRYDDLPFTEARIQEAAAEDGPWSTIDTIALDPVDSDPENPAERDFTTELASDTPDLWYRIVFADASGDTLQPTLAIQNLSEDAAFATATELAVILHLRNVTAEQTIKLNRVLRLAAGEIRSEIDADGNGLAGWELDLAEQVNLDRAADLWHHLESKNGITGILGGDEGGVGLPGRYSWERYAQRLAPLKRRWGIA